MTFTVLVTATGGGLSAETLHLLKSSKVHDIRVIAVDTADQGQPVAAHVADAFYKVPYGNSAEYAGTITDIVRREDVNLVLPCSDEEALALSAKRQDLASAGAQLACADHEVLKLVSSKERCFSWLEEHGFDVPKWRLCNSIAELKDAYAVFGREFAVKPARGRGNRDVYIVSSHYEGEKRSFSGRELHVAPDVFFANYASRIEAILPVIVSERLIAPCFDVDTLSWQGVVQRVVPRQRINPEGMPFRGNEVRSIPELAAIATGIASKLNLSWLYDFDVMTRPSDGAYTVIEINPRPSGSLAAAVAAGIPLLDDLVTLAKGQPLQQQDEITSALVLPFTSLYVHR